MKDNELYKLIINTSYTKVGIDVDYAILKKEDATYLLFQETTTKIDWKINFQFWAKPYKNQKNPMLIHRGYVKAWKSCNDEIMNTTIKAVAENNHKPLIIAGWSYGGAMAILAMEDYFFRTGLKPQVITFGGPKIIAPLAFRTKRYLKSCMDTKGKFYCHRSDIVPMIPPFYQALNKKKLGKCNLKLFFTGRGHCVYGDGNLYR